MIASSFVPTVILVNLLGKITEHGVRNFNIQQRKWFWHANAVESQQMAGHVHSLPLKLPGALNFIYVCRPKGPRGPVVRKRLGLSLPTFQPWAPPDFHRHCDRHRRCNQQRTLHVLPRLYDMPSLQPASQAWNRTPRRTKHCRRQVCDRPETDGWLIRSHDV